MSDLQTEVSNYLKALPEHVAQRKGAVLLKRLEAENEQLRSATDGEEARKTETQVVKNLRRENTALRKQVEDLESDLYYWKRLVMTQGPCR